jgi:hypothetical protein
MLAFGPRFADPDSGFRATRLKTNSRRTVMKSNIARSNEETMNHHRRRIAPSRLVVLVVLSLITVASLVKLSKATGTITKADLSGPWAMTVTGVTGCGETTMYVTFTLNSAGSGTSTQQGHSAACGDNTGSAPITITSLNPNGSGTANLSCGTGCGWDFTIQVSPDRSVFNLVDVSPANPGNFLEGVAIHQ